MSERKRQTIAQQLEIREPSGGYARNKDIPTFFGRPMVKGSFVQIDPAQITPDAPTLFYRHPNGEIWVGDAVAWLRTLQSESVDLIFADPPYNIKKAEWDSFNSQEEYVKWSLQWIEQAARVLKPTGTLYVCGFSEILSVCASQARGRGLAQRCVSTQGFWRTSDS